MMLHSFTTDCCISYLMLLSIFNRHGQNFIAYNYWSFPMLQRRDRKYHNVWAEGGSYWLRSCYHDFIFKKCSHCILVSLLEDLCACLGVLSFILVDCYTKIATIIYSTLQLLFHYFEDADALFPLGYEGGEYVETEGRI